MSCTICGAREIKGIGVGWRRELVNKKVIAIGAGPAGITESVSFDSFESVQYADILLLNTSIDLPSGRGGNSRLNYDDSSKFLKVHQHWKDEIQKFLKAGKTMFAWLNDTADVYLTRENHQTVRKHNVFCLPILLPDWQLKTGVDISIVPDQKIFAEYWALAKKYSRFEAAFRSQGIDCPLFTVQGGDSVVGALFEEEEGAIVLFPPLLIDRFDAEFKAFGTKLVNILITIDRNLRLENEQTAPPAWVDRNQFQSKSEEKLLNEQKAIELKISQLDKSKGDVAKKIEEQQALKRLLYEQGNCLNEAVIDALKVLGFKSESFDDGKSEFDVVSESAEGCFLGEVEGKDNSAINLQKFRQLLDNVNREHYKDNGAQKQKKLGVLFGNGFRLIAPEDRGYQFTNQCLDGAQREGFALVQTSDLYLAAMRIRDTNDQNYAKDCRLAILNTKGALVEFPLIAD